MDTDGADTGDSPELVSPGPDTTPDVLDTYSSPTSLYVARQPDVNINRPISTGDVFAGAAILGHPKCDMVMIVAHPCTIRSGDGRLKAVILAARVETHPHQPLEYWRRYSPRIMPLPELRDGQYYAAHLSESGVVTCDDLLRSERIACLSDEAVNLIQQRIAYTYTRAFIPTHWFKVANLGLFAEIELYEEFIDTRVGVSAEVAEQECREFLRENREGQPTREKALHDPQLMPVVLREARLQVARLNQEGRIPPVVAANRP